MNRALRFAGTAAAALLLSLAPAAQAWEELTVQTADVGDIDLAYLDAGEGTPIILLHGFPDTPTTWDAIRPALMAAGYRVITPWLRGYAPSGVPEGDVILASQAGRDVIALMDALGIQRAAVVGHDWGAAAAYAAATLAPERVERLVTVAIPHPATIRLSPGKAWKGRHFVYLAGRRGVKIMEKDDLHHVDELYARWAPSWEVPPREIEDVKRAFRSPGSLDAALAWYRGAKEDDPVFEEKVTVPTLAIGGEDDAFGPKDFDRAAEAFSGPYQVVVLPGEHWPHRQSPEAFEEVLLTFLEEE